MSAEFFTGCERLLSATANGLYQGILVAIVAGLALRFVRTNAATRHAIWFGALLFVAALIPAHFLLSWRPHVREADAPAAPVAPAVSTTALALTPLYSANPYGPVVIDVGYPDAQPDAPNAGIDDATYLAASGLQDPEPMSSGEPAQNFWPRLTKAVRNALARNVETPVNLPRSISLFLVSAWVLLAGIRGGLIAWRMVEVRRVKKTSSVPSMDLQARFNRLRRALATTRNVRLRTSSAHSSAVVLGFFHPVVLLPAEMDNCADEGEVEHVLRHELAHVERRDDWANLAQQLIQAALFFHPAVWWISRKLSLEREIACDDHVLNASERPRAYALTLANIASRMNDCRQLLAPGVSNNKSQLQQRITMILNTQRDRSPRLARSRLGLFTTATAVLAALAISAGPRLVLAEPPAEPAEPAAPAEPAPPAEPPAPSIAPVAAAAVSTSVDVAPVVTVSPVAVTFPHAVVAVGFQPALQPDSGAESGPRPKDATRDDTQPPAAPTARVFALSPDAPPPAPPAPHLVKDHNYKNMSIEERLDRIEHILENIEARGASRGRSRSSDGHTIIEVPVQPGAAVGAENFKFEFDSKRIAEEAKRAAEEGMRAKEEGLRAAEEARRAVEESHRDIEQAKREAEQAKREAEQGRREAQQERREAEAGKREAEKAMRDIAKLKGKDMDRLQEQLREAEAEGPGRALEALRGARETLQRQMETLGRQIQRLEQDQKRMEEKQNKPKKSTGSDDDAKDGQPSPSPEKPL